MTRPLRILSLLIGTLWAQALLVAGLAMVWAPGLPTDRLLTGVTLLGGGALVAMVLVIDPLVPEAGPVVVVPLKLAAVLAFLACGGMAVYGIAFGQPWA